MFGFVEKSISISVEIVRFGFEELNMRKPNVFSILGK